MRYDLDNSPVIIRMSRWKMALILIFCAILAAAGAEMTHDPQVAWVGYLGAIFFGLGIPIALYRILQPAWLELSPSGLRWFTGRKIERYAWNEFLKFRTYSPARFSRQVGFILTPQSSRNTKIGAAMFNGFGLHGGLGGAWNIGPDELANLLNRAREKWGSR